MTGTSAPNLVDYLTLAAAVIGSAASAGTTIWIARRGEKERFDLHVDWAWEPNAEDPEWPVLHIHNKSSTTILIREIRFLAGSFFPRALSGTAVYWEDPLDLDFPAAIASGQIRRFRISESGAKDAFRRAGTTAKRLGVLRRPAFWIEVKSVGGRSRRVGGEEALPWRDRPAWCKIEDEEE